MIIVLELQTTGGVTSVLSNTFSDRNAAENKYHTILSSAAVSNVEAHAAVMMNHEGSVLKSSIYYHAQVSE